ncbi:MAG: transglutaminase family protein [Burkholderiaceae bacterium]|jgi:transglutaminase-like putative cysteine protease
MSLIEIHTELEYQLASDCSFYFSILAARTDRQKVLKELLRVEPDHAVEHLPYGSGGHQLMRLSAPPGNLKISYDASVKIDPQHDDPSKLTELPFGQFPSDVLWYLNPSRYCESDKLIDFVVREFGEIAPGYGRVRTISDWVRDNLAYVAGVTDASSGTADVLLQRAGVCRDFAHVAISLCRALGIPARYVSGYGVGVEPQDFHGFFEAFLDGDWYLFDPTGMAPSDGLVRIGVGRDAADTAFATFVGSAQLVSKVVTVTRSVDSEHTPVATATSTA